MKVPDVCVSCVSAWEILSAVPLTGCCESTASMIFSTVASAQVLTPPWYHDYDKLDNKGPILMSTAISQGCLEAQQHVLLEPVKALESVPSG